jgi:preprotein translocase subunit SecE
MSEEKKAAAKTEKSVQKSGESKFSKFVNWCRNLPARIAKPFKNMFYELKKVTWPSKQKLIAYSIVVLVFMLFMGIVIGLLDMGASALVRLLIA